MLLLDGIEFFLQQLYVLLVRIDFILLSLQVAIKLCDFGRLFDVVSPHKLSIFAVLIIIFLHVSKRFFFCIQLSLQYIFAFIIPLALGFFINSGEVDWRGGFGTIITYARSSNGRAIIAHDELTILISYFVL